jgi:hypothetical protein
MCRPRGPRRRSLSIPTPAAVSTTPATASHVRELSWPPVAASSEADGFGCGVALGPKPGVVGYGSVGRGVVGEDMLGVVGVLGAVGAVGVVAGEVVAVGLPRRDDHHHHRG